MGLQDAGTIEEGTVVLPYGFAAIMLDQRFKSWLLAQDRAFIQQSPTADVLRAFNRSPWARFVHCSPMHDDPKVPMRFELPDLDSNSESVILDGFAEVIARILAHPDAAVDWRRVYPDGMPVVGPEMTRCCVPDDAEADALAFNSAQRGRVGRCARGRARGPRGRVKRCARGHAPGRPGPESYVKLAHQRTQQHQQRKL